MVITRIFFLRRIDLRRFLSSYVRNSNKKLVTSNMICFWHP